MATETSSGKLTYDQHCAACHGAAGDGNGPAAVWLYPKLRRFSSGLFKIRSTPSGSLPTDENLFRIVTRGMPGSSMPRFIYWSDADRRGVVQQVKYRTVYTNTSGQRVNFLEEEKASGMIRNGPQNADPQLSCGRRKRRRGL